MYFAKKLSPASTIKEVCVQDHDNWKGKNCPQRQQCWWNYECLFY